MMMMFILIMLLSGANALPLHNINVHSCTLRGGEELLCDWRGPGVYFPDRALVQIRVVTFVRFYDGGFINIEGGYGKDVKIIQIENGDVACQAITATGDVAVFVGGIRCSDTSASSPDPRGDSTSVGSSSSLASELSSYPGLNLEAASNPDKITTVKMLVSTRATQDGQMPLIELSWQTTTEIKVLLIILISIVIVVLFGFGLRYLINKKVKKTIFNNKQKSNSDIEIFSMPTRTSRTSDIPTYSFDEFMNDSIKEKNN